MKQTITVREVLNQTGSKGAYSIIKHDGETDIFSFDANNSAALTLALGKSVEVEVEQKEGKPPRITAVYTVGKPAESASKEYPRVYPGKFAPVNSQANVSYYVAYAKDLYLGTAGTVTDEDGTTRLVEPLTMAQCVQMIKAAHNAFSEVE